jgi:p-aminobenzoyl-glutamate transporter AbgT
MATTRIDRYLRTLKRDLWLRGLEDADTLAEVRSHLNEAVEHGLRSGLSAEEAEGQALERFGSARTVASSFEEERMNGMQKILVLIGVAAGLFLMYVDASPHWDDTGLIVLGLLLSAGLLTLVGQRRPWLVALAVGVWLPLRYIFFVNHDFTMLITLVFPFAGAYLGWAANLVLRKTLHPAA